MVEGPLIEAMHLLRDESERANKLFSDQKEATLELLRRSKEIPNLKKALVWRSAWNLISGDHIPGAGWINAEAERARRLHPESEADAIIELLTRSRDLPEQRFKMAAFAAVNVIAAGR